MKLLVFAHTPPPHHGQSYMVQLMLAGFGGDHRKGKDGSPSTGDLALFRKRGIECYHVNARVSDSLQDIGHVRFSKLLLLIWYCLQALWCRFRYGVTTFYYVPAPGKRSALIRDWLVLLCCRPFFERTVLHWHAAGMGKWLEREAQTRTRRMTYLAFKGVDVSIVLSDFNRLDADKFLPKKVLKVANGIPDPCPDFESAVLPRRSARLAARRHLLSGESLDPGTAALAGEEPSVIKVLFLGHCMRAKGLFVALEAVDLANHQLASTGAPLKVSLTVAGEFVDQVERTEFERRLSRGPSAVPVNYLGFVTGETKRRVLAESDCLCFPSFYSAESFGLVLVEAMAFGLPIVTTRWRSLPELFPANYPGLVTPRNSPEAATALVQIATSSTGEEMRHIFLEQFTLDAFLNELAKALRKAEGD